ncbi:MAG: hypothetical protein KDA57_23665, partial [Planctomycetales bacterium]|nr:hypothetical protein [Planctomycetales bacterium]
LSVIAVDAENKSVTVKGDASGLATPLTDRYHLIPPPGVARSTGALCKPEDAGESSYGGTASYDDPGTVWLWSGYRYVAPQVGHDVTGTTFGAQSGVNKLGQYHCWNRIYDIQTGRWTTPDPAMSPWWSLLAYVDGNAISRTDNTGLDDLQDNWNDLVKEAKDKARDEFVKKKAWTAKDVQDQADSYKTQHNKCISDCAGKTGSDLNACIRACDRVY